MKSSPARVTAEFLIKIGLLVAVPGSGVYPDPIPDWYAFWGKEPSAPDNIVTVMNDDAYLEPKDLRFGGTSGIHPRVQIRGRHKDAETAYNKLAAIRDALMAASMTTISVTGDSTPWKLQNFTVKNDVRFLREEEKNRRSTYFLNGCLTLLEA